MSFLAAPRVMASYWTLAGDRFPGGPVQASGLPIQDRLKAAAAAGFAGVGLLSEDLKAIEGTTPLPVLNSMIAGLGLQVELEALTGWYQGGATRARSDLQRRQLLNAANALGARHIKVCGDFVSPRGPVDIMVHEFAALCAEAADANTTIALEFIVASSVPDLSTALEIVRRADSSRGGLCLDLWHVARSNLDYQTLTDLKSAEVLHIELSDGRRVVEGKNWNDTVHNRLLPGQGIFDTTGFLCALSSIGYEGMVGVEIMSREFRTIGLSAAATSAHEAAMRALNTAHHECEYPARSSHL